MKGNHFQGKPAGFLLVIEWGLGQSDGSAGAIALTGIFQEQESCVCTVSIYLCALSRVLAELSKHK